MQQINLSVSPLFRAAQGIDPANGQPVYLELQDQPLYSLVTLPTPLTAAGGVSFFGDTVATVTLDRTNLDRPNQVPIGSTFECHGVGIRFLAPLTVVYSSFNTAMRDAYLQLTVNNSQRLTKHLSEFVSSSVLAPSFSAAAGDNPVLTQQGLDYYVNLALPISINSLTSFNIKVFFLTDVAALNATVMGVYMAGLLNRGNIKLDSSPAVPSAYATLQ